MPWHRLKWINGTCRKWTKSQWRLRYQVCFVEATLQVLPRRPWNLWMMERQLHGTFINTYRYISIANTMSPWIANLFNCSFRILNFASFRNCTAQRCRKPRNYQSFILLSMMLISVLRYVGWNSRILSVLLLRHLVPPAQWSDELSRPAGLSLLQKLSPWTRYFMKNWSPNHKWHNVLFPNPRYFVIGSRHQCIAAHYQRYYISSSLWTRTG